MALLIDTNVAIHFRDRDSWAVERIDHLVSRPVLSIMSLVELEAGVFQKRDLIEARRAILTTMVQRMTVLDLDRDVIACYGEIISALGFSRQRVIDRLIAATAIVHGLTLITINAPDFRDIPGLTLEAWEPPVQ